MVIYKITNRQNQKAYVGMTTRTPRERFEKHMSRKKGGCSAISTAVKKHGRESFSFEVIDMADNLEQLKKKESEWILKLGTMSPNGYNLTTGGEHFEMSQEVRAKISEANRRRIVKTETKEKLRRDREGVCLRKTPVSSLEKEKSSLRASEQWEKSSLRWLHKVKTGTKIYVPELQACFYSYSDFLTVVNEEGVGINDISSSVSMCSNLNRKYQKKYSVIKEEWSESRKLEYLQKSSLTKAQKMDLVLKRKKIYCHQNKTLYPSLAETCRQLGLDRSKVRAVANGKREKTKNLTFEWRSE